MSVKNRDDYYQQENIETVISADAPAAHWLLRFALSTTFLFQGLTKLGDLEASAQTFDLSPRVLAMASGVELLVPAGMLLGGLITSQIGDILTRLAGLGAIVILIGAISVVHWGQWSFAPSETHPLGGMEFQVTLIAISLYFALRGNSG